MTSGAGDNGRIFVVEDDSLLAASLSDELGELGYAVVGPAADLGTALRVAEAESMDAALLDINLRGKMVFPLAERLLQGGVPFSFMTGYGASAIPETFKNQKVLAKPFTTARLSEVLAAMLHRRGDGAA